MLYQQKNTSANIMLHQQGMSEKMSKQVEAQISDLNSRLEAATREVADLTTSKNRSSAENSDLTRQLEEAEHSVGCLTKERNGLKASLEEATRALEDETRVRLHYILVTFNNRHTVRIYKVKLLI